MRARQTILEQYSTFLELDDDRPTRWITEPRLQRSMAKLISQNDSDRFWSLYWHRLWQTNPAERLPLGHLTAYLQETCYWAASRTATQFSNTQQTLSDCFQIAIIALPKALKGFNPDQGFALTSYASAIFSSSLRDRLRQQQEVDICTNWSLLRKLSQKRLTEALLSMGLDPKTIDTYLLTWTCFKQQYQPTTAQGSRKLERPDEATWNAIAIQFNLEHRQSPHRTPDQLETWLNTCVKAARQYLTPDLVSINAPKPGQETREWLDDVADLTGGESLLSDMIAQEEVQERRDRQTEVSSVLSEAITTCDPEIQQILQLYYSGNLTQQEIAAQLNIKQYTISRRLTRAKEILLKQLAQWSSDSLHIVLTPALLENMSTVLEDWLHQTYQA
jgi:RNA polymerase sigma factor (sigma-70 family)